MSTASFRLAGILLDVEADDPALIDELASILGRPADDDSGAVHARFGASVRVRGGPARFGHLKLEPAQEAVESPAELMLGRSEERRVGKECPQLCRSRWSPYH